MKISSLQFQKISQFKYMVSSSHRPARHLGFLPFWVLLEENQIRESHVGNKATLFCNQKRVRKLIFEGKRQRDTYVIEFSTFSFLKNIKAAQAISGQIISFFFFLVFF
jgi:hypothetical protein